MQLWEGIPLLACAVIYTVLLGMWTRRENRAVVVPAAGVIGGPGTDRGARSAGPAEPLGGLVVPGGAGRRDRGDRGGCRLAGQRLGRPGPRRGRL